MENKRRRVELIVEFLQTASLLYNRNYSKEELKKLTQVYYNALSPLDDESLEKALQEAFRRCQFFPTPADILALAGRRGAEAMLDVYKAIDKGGLYSSVVFEDKKIMCVIEALGGWVEVCNMPTGVLQKKFIELYETFTNTIHAPTHFPGLVELDGWDDDRKKIPLLVVGSQIKEAFLPPARLQPFVQALARGEKFEDLLALPGGCEG